MLYMPKIADYLKILTGEINFGKCFKSTREKFYSKLGEEILKMKS